MPNLSISSEKVCYLSQFGFSCAEFEINRL